MVRRLLGFAVATALVLWPHAALAQKGHQIFDFLLQQGERQLQRQQHREYERHQRQELNRLHQAFVAQWQACHQDDVDACDHALAYPNLNFNDRQRLLSKRSQIVAAQQEVMERARRERIEAEFEERRRQREREELAQRSHAQEVARQDQPDPPSADRVAGWAQDGAGPMEALLRLPTSTYVTALVAMALGLALIMLVVQKREVAASPKGPPPLPPRPGAHAAPFQPQPASIPPAAVRDTPAAIAALELAYAYLEEVREADMPAIGDQVSRKHRLNTLALASRQLDAAHRLDPDAILEGQDQRDIPFRLTINELKAQALLLEGLTHQVYDIRRALPALFAATKADPNNANAFYVLGLTHAANKNKAEAVAAFQRAVALDPKTIAYRKELNRAESLTAAEIAGYKATRAGERIFDTGIMAWNIFAVVWNITTFPLRVVVGIFRFLGLTGFR